ncbi:MAG: hypothetical protein R2751_14370 [Bacteroidales bacterium]
MKFATFLQSHAMKPNVFENALLALFLFLGISACEKELPRVSEMHMNVGDEEVHLQGRIQKYRSIRNDEVIGVDYYLYNQESTTLRILTQAFDFVNEYNLPTDGEATYSFIDSLGDAQTYRAIGGQLRVRGETNRIVIGEFELVLTHARNTLDTLVISEGNFEITLDGDQLYWER